MSIMMSTEYKYAVQLSEDELEWLTKLVRSKYTAPKAKRRARIMMMAHSGMGDLEISSLMGVTAGMVCGMRTMYVKEGLARVMENVLRMHGRPARKNETKETGAIILTDEEKARIDAVINDEKAHPKVRRRAKALRLVDRSEGGEYTLEEVGRFLGIKGTYISQWKVDFKTKGLDAFLTWGWSGDAQFRTRTFDHDKLIAYVSQPPPAGTHRWTYDLVVQRAIKEGLVEHLSRERVRQIFLKHGIKFPRGRPNVTLKGKNRYEFIVKDEDRAILQAALDDPATQKTVRNRIKSVLNGEKSQTMALRWRRSYVRYGIDWFLRPARKPPGLKRNRRPTKMTEPIVARILEIAHSKPQKRYGRWTPRCIRERLFYDGVIPSEDYICIGSVINTLRKHKVRLNGKGK